MKQLDYIKQGYLKVKAANSILKSRIDKALRNSINENEFYISTGAVDYVKVVRKRLGNLVSIQNAEPIVLKHWELMFHY